MKTREQTSADKTSAGRYDHRATANEMKLRILAAAAVLVSAAATSTCGSTCSGTLT